METLGPKQYTHSVPVERMTWLRSEVARLAKRATKLGVSAPRLVEGPTRKLKSTGEGGLDVWFNVVDVRVEGERVSLAGWHLVAAIEHDEEGRRVRVVPGLSCPPELRDAPLTRCDHCHAARARTAVFVVEHEDGTAKVIGRTCLQDFLGGNDPNALASTAELLWALVATLDSEEGGGGGGGRGSQLASLVSFLSVVCMVARERGFVSGKQAYEASDGTQATGRDAATWLFSFPHRPPGLNRLAPPTAADVARAEAILAWAEEAFAVVTNETSDYAYNVHQSLLAGCCGSRSANIVASLYMGHARAMEEIAKRAMRKPSEHIGSVGLRADFFVTVDGVWERAGDYGVTHIVRMRTADDAVLVWFASSLEEACGAPIIGKGWSGYLLATVKKHDERNGEKQTVITRAAIVRPFVQPRKPTKAERAKKARTERLAVFVRSVRHDLRFERHNLTGIEPKEAVA